MSDLRERLQKLLAPRPPDPELGDYEQLLAIKYKKVRPQGLFQEEYVLLQVCLLTHHWQAYDAFYRHNNQNKCASKMFELSTAIKDRAKAGNGWQSYIICKTFLLGAMFEARPKALDNMDKVRRHLVMFSPGVEKPGASNFERDYSEIWDLRDQLEKRLNQEKNPKFMKETWWFHSTTSWPVRMTDAWLEQTAPTSE